MLDMFDKLDFDILKGFINKAYQNAKLNLDTIQVNWESDRVNFRTIFRFQVTHKTDESEGIEWRFQTIDFDFEPMGLYRMINDNHFDRLFKYVEEQLRESKPHYKMSLRLDKSRNEELVK